MKALKILSLCVLATLLMPTAADARVPPKVSNHVKFLKGTDTTALKIDGTEVTSTAAELNKLDGVTSTAAELSTTDGKVTATADLTSAEILALNATPISVIAAPGAGLGIVIDKVCGQVDYVSAAYAGIAAGEDVVLRATDGSGQILATLETTGWLDQTADTVVCSPGGASVIPVANAAVVAHMTTAEIITGDSPIDLQIWYTVVTLEIP